MDYPPGATHYLIHSYTNSNAISWFYVRGGNDAGTVNCGIMWAREQRFSGEPLKIRWRDRKFQHQMISKAAQFLKIDFDDVKRIERIPFNQQTRKVCGPLKLLSRVFLPVLYPDFDDRLITY